jgi:tetratricopeptide (TPR) repeat protein
MADFWQPLSDADGLELFGSVWPLDGDTVRVGRLLRRVEELGAGPTWPKALAALSTVVDRIDDPVAERRCLLHAAHLAIRWEEPMAAQIAAHLAVNIEERDDTSVDALLLIGHAFSDLGDSEMAMQLYETCRHELVRHDDIGGVAYVDMNIAIVRNGLGEHERAIDMFNDAAVVFDRAGDDDGLVACWSNLVAALRGAGRTNEALVVADRVVDLRRRDGDDLAVAMALVNRANVLVGLDEWEPAREGFIEALEINRRLGLVTEQADCLDALGTIARHDGLLEFAEQMHGEALRLYAGRDHPVDEAIARYNLAITSVHMGRFAEAVSLCDLATDVAGTDLDPGAVKAAALDGLGETRQADSLRSAWIERHGESAFANESKRLP